MSALYNRNTIYHWRAFYSCTCSPTVNHLSCKVLEFSGAFGHMGTLWCTLFHRQMITGEGKRQRQEGGGVTVLSITSSSSLSPQVEQWFLPLNLVQHSSTDNTTERCLARKDGGRIPPCGTEFMKFHRKHFMEVAALHSMHSTWEPLAVKWMMVKVNTTLMTEWFWWTEKRLLQEAIQIYKCAE